jgi:hypothetical protein
LNELRTHVEIAGEHGLRGVQSSACALNRSAVQRRRRKRHHHRSQVSLALGMLQGLFHRPEKLIKGFGLHGITSRLFSYLISNLSQLTFLVCGQLRGFLFPVYED